MAILRSKIVLVESFKGLLASWAEQKVFFEGGDVFRGSLLKTYSFQRLFQAFDADGPCVVAHLIFPLGVPKRSHQYQIGDMCLRCKRISGVLPKPGGESQSGVFFCLTSSANHLALARDLSSRNCVSVSAISEQIWSWFCSRR